MALFLKHCIAVVVGNIFEMKRLIILKLEIMTEFTVKFWGVFLGKILRVFAFR